MVGQHEGHPACIKAGCWFVGGDNLTGTLNLSQGNPGSYVAEAFTKQLWFT